MVRKQHVQLAKGPIVQYNEFKNITTERIKEMAASGTNIVARSEKATDLMEHVRDNFGKVATDLWEQRDDCVRTLAVRVGDAKVAKAMWQNSMDCVWRLAVRLYDRTLAIELDLHTFKNSFQTEQEKQISFRLLKVLFETRKPLKEIIHFRGTGYDRLSGVDDNLPIETVREEYARVKKDLNGRPRRCIPPVDYRGMDDEECIVQRDPSFVPSSGNKRIKLSF